MTIVPAMFAAAAAAYSWSHGNIGVVLLAAALVLLFAVGLLLNGLVYLATIQVDVTRQGVLQRHGFPFRRLSADMSGGGRLEEATIDYGLGLVTTGWLLVNGRRECQGLLIGDYWEPATVQSLAKVVGIPLVRQNQTVLYKELRSMRGRECKRW